jgi:hypothetical protein
MGQETILRPILNSLKENVLSEILLIVMRDSNLTEKYQPQKNRSFTTE